MFSFPIRDLTRAALQSWSRISHGRHQPPFGEDVDRGAAWRNASRVGTATFTPPDRDKGVSAIDTTILPIPETDLTESS